VRRKTGGGTKKRQDHELEAAGCYAVLEPTAGIYLDNTSVASKQAATNHGSKIKVWEADECCTNSILISKGPQCS